ncbi:MAG TPA: hydrogenase maturation nickel metallochaperone HypA [Clostridiaceae bacterium]|nr:hydrogenase maturation nickel metallochaperone HypA [Clostridiaceae bacterium]
MHELPLTQKIFRAAMRHAEKNGAIRITEVCLKVGEMRDFVEEVTQKYWDHLSRGSIAEGSKIRFVRIGASASCNVCGTSFPFDWRSPEKPACTSCGSETVHLLTGTELEIEQISILS